MNRCDGDALDNGNCCELTDGRHNQKNKKKEKVN